MQKTTQDIDLEELAEHQQILIDIAGVINTPQGLRVFTYLFKHFEYGELPDIGLPNEFLYDKLGSLRPGRALFRVVSEADPKLAGLILANIEKEKITKERNHVIKKV